MRQPTKSTGKKMRTRPEEQAQREILAYIAAVIPRSLCFAVPNASRRTPTGRASNGVPGLHRGASDLCLCLPKGRVIFIEVKAPKGRSSDVQIEFGSKLLALSHSYFVARSQDDVRRAFEALGVETREAKKGELYR